MKPTLLATLALLPIAALADATRFDGEWAISTHNSRGCNLPESQSEARISAGKLLVYDEKGSTAFFRGKVNKDGKLSGNGTSNRGSGNRFVLTGQIDGNIGNGKIVFPGGTCRREFKMSRKSG